MIIKRIRKIYKNQQVYQSTSNYITHYKTQYKAFNIDYKLQELGK